jgi:hypothetical protein
MRKYLYAGAVAAGFLLLGAAPVYADVQPAPAGAQGGLLDPADGIDLGNPLGGSPLLNVDPGDNSIFPRDAVPPARTGFGQASSDAAKRPAAAESDGTREAPPVAGDGVPTGSLSQLPVANLFSGGIPVVGGLLPNGRSPLGSRADQESGLFDNGLPLLGGFGGMLPGDSTRTRPAVSGMPAGGTALPAGDQVAPARPGRDTPNQAKPGKPKPATVDPAIANDHRLHEEPTDPEDTPRPFSSGRPVARP